MGKYSSRIVKPSMPKRNTVNPYMQGIGCLLILIVPVFSYAVGDVLAGQGFGYPLLPREWYGYLTFPTWLSTLAGLSFVLQRLSSIPHLPATLAIAVIVMIVVGGITAVIFGWMYSLLAPSQYGPMDVPPPRVKTKKYKR
jgi:drug/metabolite transporter (DMT)-like permease